MVRFKSTGDIHPFRRRSGCAAHNGFTLIELLVVISIISVLMAILLPSLHRARSQAKQVKCLSNIRQMGQAGGLFAEEHNGLFQLAAAEEAIEHADRQRKKYEYVRRGELVSWPVAMATTTGMSDFFDNYHWGVRANNFEEALLREDFMSEDFPLSVCPADPVRISTPFYPRGATLKPLPDDLDLPEGDSYWGYLSYGINEDLVGADDRSGPNADAYDCWKDGKRGQMQDGAGDRLKGDLTRIYDPSTCLLLVDAGPDSELDARKNPDDFANLIISAQANGPMLADFQLKWKRRMPLKRHPKGRLNVLFSDMHGETITPIDFYSTETLSGIPKDYNAKVRVSPYEPWG